MIAPHDASRAEWDAVVAGAGPAGAVAAREVARLGLQVMLVDKSDFPRDKVCGTCLNLQAISVLRGIGLSSLLNEHGGVELERFHLAGWGRRAEICLPTGVALSRSNLDLALVQHAVGAGVEFLPRTRVSLGKSGGDSREVVLRPVGTDHRVSVSCRVFIDATGLGGVDPRIDESVSPRSRIGIGAHLRDDASHFDAGTIHMALGEGGYVGVVRLGGDDLNLAAAVDPEFLRHWRRPATAAAHLLRQAGFPVPEGIADAPWHGTRPLTRFPRAVSEQRLFRVGDAAGYVEPFTGEGMAWAVRSAVEVAPLVHAGCRRWRPELRREWARIHGRIVGRRQWFCQIVSALLKRPTLSKMALMLLSRYPDLAVPVVRHLNPRVSIPS